MLLLGFIAYQLLFAQIQVNANDDALKLSFLAFLWLLLLYALVNTFSGMPSALKPEVSLLANLKGKISRFAMWLLSVLFILLTLAILMISSRMLNVLS